MLRRNLWSVTGPGQTHEKVTSICLIAYVVRYTSTCGDRVGGRVGVLRYHWVKYNFSPISFQTHLNSKLATLQDYAVQPFSTVHLIVVLYEISDQSLDRTIFDVFRGYPARTRDYLDASVLIYSGYQLEGIVDFRQSREPGFFCVVYHSGDVIDDSKRLSHHTINVMLESLPATTDKLFFTLSAWNSPNISKFKHPSLRFFDAKEPNKRLCSDQMQLIPKLCSLAKINGSWKVFRLRTPSAGNAKNYGPLQQKFLGIISQGLC